MEEIDNTLTCFVSLQLMADGYDYEHQLMAKYLIKENKIIIIDNEEKFSPEEFIDSFATIIIKEKSYPVKLSWENYENFESNIVLDEQFQVFNFKLNKIICSNNNIKKNKP